MTVRERWQATIKMQNVDRLLFWPKLGAGYQEYRSGKLNFKTLIEYHQWIGSELLFAVPSCVKDKYNRCSVRVDKKGDMTFTTINTPFGDLTKSSGYSRTSFSDHPVDFPVKTREDIKRMIAFIDDITIEKSESGIERGKELYTQFGDYIFAWEPIDESPLMKFVEYIAGVENAHLLLFDYPEDIEALFDALHRYNKRKAEMVCDHSVADMVAFIENTSTSLISPDQYKKYCFNHISDYSRICADRERILALHMCGFLKDILQDVKQVGAKVFEAFTSPPVGNTPFNLGRKKCPDICLIGGTNAAIWTTEADSIIAHIEADLDRMDHHRGLVVSSAGVMPPMCEPETIKRVSDWVHNYNCRM